MYLSIPRKLMGVTYILVFTSINGLFSQSLPSEDKHDLMQEQRESIARFTDSLIFKQTDFLNGKMHFPVNDKIHHPYLGSNEWQKGKLNYRGDTFTVTSLKYDIKADHLVALPYNIPNSFPIALNKNYIKGFELSERTFSYFTDIQLPLRTIPDGYLEVIYDGESKFFLKWKKEETVDNTLRQIEYDQLLFMLFWKDGQYHRVRNKMGLLFRLGDKRSEVRQFIRENNIQFDKNNYSSAKRILEYYDKL